jgi:hypothetical protein
MKNWTGACVSDVLAVPASFDDNGYADLAIGALLEEGTAMDVGEARVRYGAESWVASLDYTMLISLFPLRS